MPGSRVGQFFNINFSTTNGSVKKDRTRGLDTEARPVGVLFIAGTEETVDQAQLRSDPEARIIRNDPQAVRWALGAH
jgi:hypothetical protein